MEQRVLPVPPYQSRRTIIRGNEPYTIVRGIQDEGMAYYWIQKDVLDELGTKTAWVFRGMDVQSREPKKGDSIVGVVQHIKTFWLEFIMLNDKYLSPVGMVEMKTNEPDLIGFSALQGDENGDHFINGFFRDILGFNNQPPYVLDNTTGKMIVADETLYDTTLPPIGGYRNMQPQTIQVDEPVQDTPST